MFTGLSAVFAALARRWRTNPQLCMRKPIIKNTETLEAAAGGFDLVRLSSSKETVDVCPNTMRGYFKQGLPCYRRGKAVFFSKAELSEFIKGAR